MMCECPTHSIDKTKQNEHTDFPWLRHQENQKDGVGKRCNVKGIRGHIRQPSANPALQGY